jgi:putative membrane protein
MSGATTHDRPVHILVALDWVKHGLERSLMERACRLARWPVVLRGDGLSRQSGQTAYTADEGPVYLRRAVRESVELLRAGELLVVFPEAYPNVDPAYTPKTGDGFLRFRPGFVRLVELAQRDGQTRVPIIPTGFAYEPLPGGRWHVVMRFGQPIWLDDPSDVAGVARAVEDQVRYFSSAVEPAGAVIPQQAVS